MVNKVKKPVKKVVKAQVEAKAKKKAENVSKQKVSKLSAKQLQAHKDNLLKKAAECKSFVFIDLDNFTWAGHRYNDVMLSLVLEDILNSVYESIYESSV